MTKVRSRMEHVGIKYQRAFYLKMFALRIFHLPQLPPSLWLQNLIHIWGVLKQTLAICANVIYGSLSRNPLNISARIKFIISVQTFV